MGIHWGQEKSKKSNIIQPSLKEKKIGPHGFMLANFFWSPIIYMHAFVPNNFWPRLMTRT
jgi:hypothetical protein